VAKGTTIEKLYLSLGLDISQLDADLITASSTVAQGMASLKTKAQQTKLKMEIDMSQFKGAENSTEALATKTKYLTSQLTIQKQAVSLINAAYAESVATKGKDDGASQRLLTRLLREQKAEADLAAQIRQTNAARAGNASGSSSIINAGATNAASAAVGALAGSLGRVRDAGQSAGNSIMLINTKIIALTAIAASGAGLFGLVKGAVDAGDAAYKLASRLNLTAAESGQLGRMLKLTDTDSQAFISTMVRLDRSVATAGKSGNAITNAMELFGFSLTDANHQLLPMNQQLEQLALGYKNAAAAGEEEAFTAEVLGSRGAALVAVLRDYTVNAEAASRVKTIGLDPKEMHDMAVKMKVLDMETAQMKNALGAALVPIAKEIIPDIISGFDLVITAIKENKDNIISVTDAAIGLLTEIRKVGSEVIDITTPAIKGLFNLAGLGGINSTTEALKEMQVELRAISNHPAISAVAAGMGVLNNVPGWKDKLESIKAEAQAQIDAETEVAIAEKAIQSAKIADDKLAATTAKKTAEDQASAIIQAKKKEMDSAKANAKAQIELADEVYKSTHTQLENELHDVDVKTTSLIASGVSESTALEISEARKKIIIDKSNKEIQKSVDEMDTAIYKLTHSALESRLRDIDEERKAWIKKTGDEVKATELAEQEKTKAIKDAVYAQQGEEIRAVASAIKAGTSISDAYREAHAKVVAEQKADSEAYNYVKQQMGVYEPGDIKRTVVVEDNSAYQLTEVIKELTLNMANFEPNKSGRNNSSGGNVNTVTVNVPVNATINNDTDITAVANKVADIIQAPLIKALNGGDDNGY